jgi:hypothetical protein
VQYLIDLYRNDSDTVLKKQRLLRAKAFELQYALDWKGEVSVADHNSWPNELLDTNNPLLIDELKNRNDSVSLLDIFVSKLSDMNKVSDKDAKRPMRDAYNIAIDHVLGWHSGAEPDVRIGK